ncbi:DUF6683 family protein [Sphingomonas xinjiangensis]|uniref:Uncharacterized protein n=1 Tax=Sphingomonas xinjiangensis TaxID=643568 RepID=A0A840YC31_9SPHN|nr:DUF6683 family protein [Sphingomonas xinjiangensis]MBB5710917.1 hypothetical protein [Sphingomonas xinjiangensis]
MKRAAAILLGLSLIWPASASAQNMGWSTIIPSVTGTDTLGLHLREQMRGQPRSSQPRGSSQSRRILDAPAASSAQVAQLRYTPSKARRAANLKAFVSKTRAIDPGNAQDLERLFAQGDFIDRLGGLLAPLGIRVDNVADAYTVWMIAAWNATRGRNETPSRGKVQAVRSQLERALGSSTEIAGAGDAAKQELAEALLVQMALVDTAVSQNEKNPDGLRRFGAAVNQGAKRMGLDLTAMELTESGFVPISASSIEPPIAEEGPSKPSGTPNPSYGMLALVAGGAGVGVGGAMLLRRNRS